MALIFLILLIAPFIGAFQVCYAIGLAIAHPNRDKLMPHLGRYLLGVVLYFPFIAVLNAFQFHGGTPNWLVGLYVLVPVALFFYNLWIMVNRNKIGCSDEPSGQDHQDPFVGADSPNAV